MGTVYVPLVCHYNGELKRDTRNTIYVGGQMEVDRVNKNISFREFVLKMHELCKSPPEDTTIRIKCRYHCNQHTSIALQVEDDDSLSFIMNLYPLRCYAIVAYIEKQPAQNSTTATRRGYLSDSVPGSHNEEAIGELRARQVVGNTIETKQGDVQNHEGVRHRVNASPIHMYETLPSLIVADHLHDMANTPAEINAHGMNQLAGGSSNNAEFVAIDVYSSASNVPSPLPSGFIIPQICGRGVLVEDTVAIAKQYLLSYFLIDILAVLPLPQDCSSERYLSFERQFSTRDGLSSRKIWTTISSVSERIQRGFAQGSDGIKSIIMSLNFHFLSDSSKAKSKSRKKILDPQGPFLQRWNKIFLLSCVIAVYLDPLFFYIPVIDDKKHCIDLDKKLEITACVLRSFIDIFYILRIIFQFRTGFIAPSSRVFGRGVLVEDPMAIAKRYLLSYFLIDILAVLPLPQVVFLIIIPKLRASVDLNIKFLLWSVILFQYFPRFLRIYLLYKEVRRTIIITKTAWVGAAFNFSVYMLTSHIFGASWYFLSIERESTCWHNACRSTDGCYAASLYCGDYSSRGGNAFLYASCPIIEPNTRLFDFGIYLDALQSGVVESRDFPQKLVYCFWWGLQNLGSLGQNLKTSTYNWEVSFAVSVSIVGLFLLTLLIGNVQLYMQSNNVKLEKEMNMKLQVAERWMSHRSLPENLRERIRQYVQYKWKVTRGYDEEYLICDLPKDLRRDIKRHLCLALLMRVPVFEIMDEHLLDAMCHRLKQALYTDNSYIVREGDPVDEMVFITRGKLLSVTTDGGRTGFFNSAYIKDGDFCGEELLTWALDPHSSNLPISTRTVRAMTEVEAFVLTPDDLKVVASQFRHLHSKQIQHTFRFYSMQWRTWAACFIQAAWRRYRKKKWEQSLREEDRLQDALAKGSGSSSSFGATIYASRFATNTLRAIRRSGTRKAKAGENATNAASESSRA